MDNFILIETFGSFIVFLIAHVIVLRRISDRSVIPIFWMTYAVTGAIAYILLYGIVSTRLPIQSAIFVTAVSWLLYTLLVGNYFMGIFGLMESSIRMRILGEVVRAGSDGIPKRTLLTQYNYTKIVDKRLARFVASGDIDFVHDAYVSRKPLTFFLLPAMILRFAWWAYGRTNIVYVK